VSQGEKYRESTMNWMVSVLGEGSKTDEFVVFAGKTEKGQFDEKTRRKLSAYRALAYEQGVLLGPFEYHEKRGTVTAKMVAFHELKGKE
jgi:hypothetical protein